MQLVIKENFNFGEEDLCFNFVEKNFKVGCRKLVELFGVGKMQIVVLIKDK